MDELDKTIAFVLVLLIVISGWIIWEITGYGPFDLFDSMFPPRPAQCPPTVCKP